MIISLNTQLKGCSMTLPSDIECFTIFLIDVFSLWISFFPKWYSLFGLVSLPIALLVVHNTVLEVLSTVCQLITPVSSFIPIYLYLCLFLFPSSSISYLPIWCTCMYLCFHVHIPISDHRLTCSRSTFLPLIPDACSSFVTRHRESMFWIIFTVSCLRPGNITIRHTAYPLDFVHVCIGKFVLFWSNRNGHGVVCVFMYVCVRSLGSTNHCFCLPFHRKHPARTSRITSPARTTAPVMTSDPVPQTHSIPASFLPGSPTPTTNAGIPDTQSKFVPETESPTTDCVANVAVSAADTDRLVLGVGESRKPMSTVSGFSWVASFF